MSGVNLREMAWAGAPILAGVYFVLELAASNADESLRLGDLLIPLAANTGLAVALTYLGVAFARDRVRGALIAVAVLTAFSTFGYAVLWLEDRWAFDRVTWAPRLLLAGVVALLGFALTMRVVKTSLDTPARFTGLFLCLLASLAAMRWAYAVVATDLHLPSPPIASRSPARMPDRLPDIYLIVPDKYTGSRFLGQRYGFDNRQFERFLAERGFVVPLRARSNYVHTFLSLASMLNARYLDDLPARLGVDATSRRAVDRLVEYNALMMLLRERGYRLVFLPTAYPVTRRNRLAHIQLPSPERVRPEFVTAWLWTTPVPLLHEHVCLLLGCALERSNTPPERAELIDWKFDQLERLPADGRPTFVFMHLAVPHEPYLYRGDCRHRRPFWPWPDTLESAKRAYAEQVACVNRKLQRLIESIQARSAVPPVILIQSDHGHARLGRRVPPAAGVRPELQEERASVFAAYHLPGVPKDQVPESVTPVNLMRLVLRSYLGVPLDPLEDATYWSSTEQPYRFQRLPDPSRDGRLSGADPPTETRGPR